MAFAYKYWDHPRIPARNIYIVHVDSETYTGIPPAAHKAMQHIIHIGQSAWYPTRGPVSRICGQSAWNPTRGPVYIMTLMIDM